MKQAIRKSHFRFTVNDKTYLCIWDPVLSVILIKPYRKRGLWQKLSPEILVDALVGQLPLFARRWQRRSEDFPCT